jgi:hypothetical protein
VVTISFVGAASTAHRLLVPVGFVGLGLGLLPEPPLPDVPWPSLLGCRVRASYSISVRRSLLTPSVASLRSYASSAVSILSYSERGRSPQSMDSRFFYLFIFLSFSVTVNVAGLHNPWIPCHPTRDRVAYKLGHGSCKTNGNKPLN